MWHAFLIFITTAVDSLTPAIIVGHPIRFPVRNAPLAGRIFLFWICCKCVNAISWKTGRFSRIRELGRSVIRGLSSAHIPELVWRLQKENGILPILRQSHGRKFFQH
jgi:hypothetical protein